MKIVEKLDKQLFTLTNKIVIRWVKKHKYEKHKFDFQISMKQWEIAY